MEFTLENLKAYLAEYPQKYAFGDIHGLVDVLFWDYFENNGITSEGVRRAMKEAEDAMQGLGAKRIDRVFDDLFRTCIEFQRAAFTAGIQVGTRLTLELTHNGSAGL